MRRFAVLLIATITTSVLAWGQNAVSPCRNVLIVGGIDNHDVGGTHFPLSSAEVYDELTHGFASTGSTNDARDGHTATTLRDGRVLVTGGWTQTAALASAEVYDPNRGSFESVDNMHSARGGHVAALLRSGKVLLAGGNDFDGSDTPTAEIFDPGTGTFSLTGPMNVPRIGATATLLNNGKVLVAGGYNATDLLSTAELYDPTTGTFSLTGSMSIPREWPTANLLPDGKVLVAGGGSMVGNCSGCSVSSAEIYDPSSERFSTVGSMSYSRRGHVAVSLRNRQVLVAGGIDDDLSELLNSAEVFDAQTFSFTTVGGMSVPRFDAAATLLEDGTALVTGGFIDRFTLTDTAEFYNPATRQFDTTNVMTDARGEHTANCVSTPLVGSPAIHTNK